MGQQLTQVFVQNTGDVASQVAAGDFASVTADTLQIFGGAFHAVGDSIDIGDVGTPVVEDYNWIQLVLGAGGADGQPLYSPQIKVSDILSVNKAVYAAPVAQESDIPAGTVPAAGGEAIVVLTQLANLSEQPNRSYTFTSIFDAGDGYSNADLISQINASSAPFTASDGGAGVLTITADDVGEPFEVGLDGILTGLTVTLVAAADKGVNTAAQILVLEKFCQGTFGEYYVQNNQLGPRAQDSFVYPPPLFADVVTPGTYDTWTLIVKNDNDTDSVARGISYAQYIIALEDAVTNEAELDAFFASIQTSV